MINNKSDNKKLVLALGGNALGNNPREQLEIVKKTSRLIIDLIKQGYKIVISHGNGPQIGMINNAFDIAGEDPNISEMPFPECNAMSQGYIGYHIQNSIRNELIKNNIDKEVVSIITQVLVDIEDKGFNNPTKPIGRFYSKEEGEELEKITGSKYIEDAGRGYRRVIASPEPKSIIEINSIKNLIDTGNIVIAGGGGGIPVYKKENEYIGIDAVIDKDFVSSMMADKLDSDILIILTAVDNVYINYGKEDEKKINSIDLNNLERYIDEDQFSSGSMLPKILAAKRFVSKGNDRKALITSIDKLSLGLNKNIGTWIYKDLE